MCHGQAAGWGRGGVWGLHGLLLEPGSRDDGTEPKLTHCEPETSLPSYKLP